MALDFAGRIVDRDGAAATVVSARTIKPLDGEGVAHILCNHEKVVVLEEHVPHGGLGSRVKEVAWDIRASCELVTFTLKDEFIHYYGNHSELLERRGLDFIHISTALDQALYC